MRADDDGDDGDDGCRWRGRGRTTRMPRCVPCPLPLSFLFLFFSYHEGSGLTGASLRSSLLNDEARTVPCLPHLGRLSSPPLRGHFFFPLFGCVATTTMTPPQAGGFLFSFRFSFNCFVRRGASGGPLLSPDGHITMTTTTTAPALPLSGGFFFFLFTISFYFHG